MKRPVAITTISATQVLFGCAALVAVIREASIPGWPEWFTYWAGLAAVSHVLSGILLFRLSWFGPASFVFLWLGSNVIGNFLLVPDFAHRTVLGVLSQIVIIVIYGGIIYFYRAAFFSEGSLTRKTPSRDSA